MIEEMTTGKDNSEKIRDLETQILSRIKPQEFGGKDGIEVMVANDFIKSSLLISEKFNVSTDNMKCIEYLLAIEKLKKDASDQNKRIHRHKRR